MSCINSLDHTSPLHIKPSSENHLNFSCSGPNSLIIHQEEDSVRGIGSTGQLSRVNEDAQHEEDLVNHQEFFHHLSLRFYGQDTDGMAEVDEDDQCRSEPDLYYGENEGIIGEEEAESPGNDSTPGCLKVRSFTALPYSGPRRKKSCVKEALEGQNEEGKGETDTDRIEGKVMNRRSANKSEGPIGIKGLLNPTKIETSELNTNNQGEALTHKQKISQGKMKHLIEASMCGFSRYNPRRAKAGKNMPCEKCKRFEYM